MALIKCPECTKEISTTATSCPHCGYVISEAKQATFEKKVCPLSSPTVAAEDKKKAKSELIGGIACFAVGIPTIAIFIGILFILVGIWCFIQYYKFNRQSQIGNCPYCNTELKVFTGNSSFICPVCNNVGNQTDTSLESTH